MNAESNTPSCDTIEEQHQKELNFYLSGISKERYGDFVRRQYRELLELARELEKDVKS